jgi:hypothetical protein
MVRVVSGRRLHSLIAAGADYFVESLVAEMCGPAVLRDAVAAGGVGTRVASPQVVDVLVERGVLQRGAGPVTLVRADGAAAVIDRAVAERDRGRGQA